MTRLFACFSLLALLGACATGPGTVADGVGSTYDPVYFDPGPYFSQPPGGLAATAYWGLGQYNPYAGWSWVHWSELGY